MDAVQKAIRECQDLHEQVRGHQLVGQIRDDGCYLRAIYKPNTFARSGEAGVQIPYGIRLSKLDAYRRLLKHLDADVI